MEGIRRSPVEVGSLPQYVQGFITSQVVVWDFWTINSTPLHVYGLCLGSTPQPVTATNEGISWQMTISRYWVGWVDETYIMSLLESQLVQEKCSFFYTTPPLIQQKLFPFRTRFANVRFFWPKTKVHLLSKVLFRSCQLKCLSPPTPKKTKQTNQKRKNKRKKTPTKTSNPFSLTSP